MDSKRSKLTLDEQAFQDLLAAAYTVQEHLKTKTETTSVCSQCGATVPTGQSLCATCATKDAPLPGDHMQRKWASLWQTAQERGLWPNRSPVESDGTASEEVTDSNLENADRAAAADSPLELESVDLTARAQDEETEGVQAADIAASGDIRLPLEPGATADLGAEIDTESGPQVAGWRHTRLKLRIHRTDIYLIAAISFGLVVLLWAISAPPADRGATGRPHAARLTLWERAMVGLGIAEAPDPPVYRGNANAKVWVDPHAALYYCPGEEQYGKTDGGRYSTQKEAQMDHFEPAERAACE